MELAFENYTLQSKLMQSQQNDGTCPNQQSKTGPVKKLPPLLSDEDISQIIQRCISKTSEDLFSIGKTDDGISKDLRALVNPLLSWVRHVASSGGSAVSKLSDTAMHGYCVDSVQGIEETLWSPFLGMKGKLDMITTATLRDLPPTVIRPLSVPKTNSVSHASMNRAHNTNHHCHPTPGRELGLPMVSDVSERKATSYVMPLELKTGKWKASTLIVHRAQVRTSCRY